MSFEPDLYFKRKEKENSKKMRTLYRTFDCIVVVFYFDNFLL